MLFYSCVLLFVAFVLKLHDMFAVYFIFNVIFCSNLNRFLEIRTQSALQQNAKLRAFHEKAEM